jgi:hypothetical protein
MAHAVGLSPEELEEIGRTDAADLLRDIRSRNTAASTATSIPVTETPFANPVPAVPPRWLQAEMERIGGDYATTINQIKLLRQIADGVGYTLAELLLGAGLITPGELQVRIHAPNAPLSAIDDFERQALRVLEDPHLSRGQRRDAEELLRRLRSQLTRDGSS